MPHEFTQSTNPRCVHCGLNAHHLSQVILTEPCPVADTPLAAEILSIDEQIEQNNEEELGQSDDEP